MPEIKVEIPRIKSLIEEALLCNIITKLRKDLEMSGIKVLSYTEPKFKK